MEVRLLAIGDVDVAGVVAVGDHEAVRIRRRERGPAVRPGTTAVLRDREVDAVAAGRRAIPGKEGDVVDRVVFHRAREARVRRADDGRRVIGEPPVGRLDHDRVVRCRLVVRHQHGVVVEERQPLPVGAGAMSGHAARQVAAGGREAVAVVGRGCRGEAAQGAEARIRVLVVPLRVLRQRVCHPTVASTTGRLLSAGRSTEHVELVAAVCRDLRVVGALREAGRAAGEDVPGLVGPHQRFGLVALRVRGNGRGELQPLSRRGRQRRLEGARRDDELAAVRLEQGVGEAARQHAVGAAGEVQSSHRLGRTASVARADLVAVRPDHGEDLVSRVLCGRSRRPRDRERELGV